MDIEHCEPSPLEGEEAKTKGLASAKPLVFAGEGVSYFSEASPLTCKS
jgi:hypothetical protein